MSQPLPPPTQWKENEKQRWLHSMWNKLLSLSLSSSDFANQGTATTVLHGSASGNPSWGAVSLENDVSGFLKQNNLPDLEASGSKLYSFYNSGGF